MSDRSEWEAYYERLVAHARAEQFASPDWNHPYLKRLRRLASLDSARDTLEFGSGRGSLSLAIKRVRPELNVCCLDYSQGALLFSRSLFRRFKTSAWFVNGNFLRLPFPDRSFDLVHGNTVLEHVLDTAEALRELTRVLRPGGYLLVTVPNRNRPDGHTLYDLANDVRYTCLSFGIDELERLVVEADCRIVERFGVSALWVAPSWVLYLPRTLIRRWRAAASNAPSKGERRSRMGILATERRARLITRAVRAFGRSVDFGWLAAQGSVNSFVDRHRLLPPSACLTIGVVAQKPPK